LDSLVADASGCRNAEGRKSPQNTRDLDTSLFTKYGRLDLA